jgi:peptidoglycan/xylan/chitin deacetylase (PgdA/CDA1 family)
MSLREKVYDRIGWKGQSYLDRFRYQYGLLPRVNPHTNNRLPTLPKATIVISVDLELAWAWRYVRNYPDPNSFALLKAEQTRQNLPEILQLFDRYEFPATWATVGHLFLESCKREEGKAHPEMLRPTFLENEFWHFQAGDWYDDDPSTDYLSDPAWYAPDLLRTILSTKTKHEIACHTFSHIDCSDENCPPEVVEAELMECHRLASKWGIHLTSFVFPGNLPGNLASLKKCGIKRYRWHGQYELDVPRRDKTGLWQIPGGIFLEKPQGWPVREWINAIHQSVNRAIESRTMLHFWFHPSCNLENIQVVLPSLLEYIHSKRNDLIISTMDRVIE